MAMQIKTNTADGHFPASDLQENTKQLIEIRNEIKAMFTGFLIILAIISIVFVSWALPIFIRLINHLLSSN